MTALEQWQQSNARQLSEALAKLRDRLERIAPRATAATVPAQPAPGPATPATAPKTVSRSFLEKILSRPALAGSPSVEKTRDPAEAVPAPELPSALTILGQRLGLSDFEKDVLLLCAAMEIDTRIPALCARAQDDAQKPYPTFALALAMFDEAAWDIVSPNRPLRYFRLIEIVPTGTIPLTASPLRADERIVNFLKGLDHLDERLAAYCTPTLPVSAELAASQMAVAEDIARRMQPVVDTASPPLVQLIGADAEARWLVAQDAAARLGKALYRISAGQLPAAPAEIDAFARLWDREGLLLPLALFLEASELDAAPAEKLAPLQRFLARAGNLVFLGVRELFAGSDARPALVFDVEKATPAEQQAAWADALGTRAMEDAALLAGQFDLSIASIRELAQSAASDTRSAPDTIGRKAWELCRARERPRLDALAQRLEPKVTRADLVLPKSELDLIDQIAAQVKQRRKVYGEWGFGRKMNRGLGIAALFAGPSGTGKTMAAEVLASELRLNLYRIDLSAVVSKYIGETEKNLRRLFDAAEGGGAILFFDEADALFGKRSEVRDSHDRYANLEVSYLLQRIESWRGLAILTSNMRQAIDSAFLRRLRFIVNFPFPDDRARAQIWQRAFPAAAPQEGLDTAKLARLSLSGGNIRNVALNAAFLAADEARAIGMRHLRMAAEAEFAKIEKPLPAGDVGDWL